MRKRCGHCMLLVHATAPVPRQSPSASALPRDGSVGKVCVCVLLQAGLYDTPATPGVPAATAEGLHARSGTADTAAAPPSAATAFVRPPAKAAATAAMRPPSGIIQAWVESARDTLARGVANFSGFSLPAPSDLLDLLPPRSKMAAGNGLAGGVGAAAVDPDAAAALRRRVEGEIMTRSASSASLDKMLPNGAIHGYSPAAAGVTMLSEAQQCCLQCSMSRGAWVPACLAVK